ncbi:MAG: right-handed parallel beta-helix repeat-containing protein [Bacteroidota bacterium]
MIIKTSQRARVFVPFLRQHRWKILASVAVLAGILSIRSFHWGGHKPMDTFIHCGAETVKHHDGKSVFVSEGHIFSGGNSQTREEVRTGQFASRLDAKQQYGIGYIIHDAKIGERYRAVAWRKGHKYAASYLTVNIQSEPQYFKQEGTAVEVDDEEWEKLELIFEVSTFYRNEPIYIYMHGGDVPVYVDDFSVEKIQEAKTKDSESTAVDFPQLNFSVGDAGLRKLKRRRQEAFYQGILFSSPDDWVKGHVQTPSAHFPAKFRFKGDWMDHLTGDKWSFRIKIKEPYAWKRMFTFSVQNPKTRFYLREWEYHQLLDREGLLTTQYDFLKLSLNGRSKGVYAYEEHFEKHLIESRGRREGPIVKFSEIGVWEIRKRKLDMERDGLEMEELLHSMESARAEPFGETSLLQDSLLTEQFEVAQTLMHQYQAGLSSASMVFDLNKLAKFYALTDLSRAYHGLVWHNQRFYFNPITNKLEPIGYDGFTEAGEYPLTAKPFLGAGVHEVSGDQTSDLLLFPFIDTAFMRHYIQYLDTFSHPSYVDNFLLDISEAHVARTQLIRSEYPEYTYTPAFPTHAERIRSVLFPVDHASLKAFTQTRTSDHQGLQLANFHLLPIELIGWGRSPEDLQERLSQPLWLNGYDSERMPQYHSLDVPKAATYLFFRLPGTHQLFVSSIHSSPLPAPSTPYQQLVTDLSLTPGDLFTIDSTSLSFLPGRHIVREPILIPKGYQVRFPAGTSLDFVKGAFFLSHSPVYMMGSQTSPIRIHSSDRSGQGFALIEARETSVMKWVVFDHLTNLNQKGWRLTGAVSVYESPVRITHCSFSNAHCEDALNLIRSPFDLQNSHISSALSDGLDVDFSKGKIDHLAVSNTGNDGIDLSGSEIILSNCRIQEAGDKGISVGEYTIVTIESANIESVARGVVAKDLSNVHIKNIHLKTCKTGFAAYQKKPEYGGAHIQVDQYQAEAVQHLHLVEKGSTLKLNGKLVPGI